MHITVKNLLDIENNIKTCLDELNLINIPKIIAVSKTFKIDFMPLTSVNYSGGIIITDWYSDGNNSNESIKISIRFLTNEIRSDALDIKIFTRKCLQSLMNCKIIETDKILINELKKEILKKAALYAKEKKDDDFKPYTNKGLGIE